MKHFSSFFARHGGQIFFALVVLTLIAVIVVSIYFLMRVVREKREIRQLMATFRVTVPSDAGPVDLRYGHIELLSELVQPRTEEYFRAHKAEWDSRLDGDLADAIAMFTSAQLIRRSRSVEGGAVLSVKGAALVAEHGSDGHARRAAASRVRKRQSKKQYPNEKNFA